MIKLIVQHSTKLVEFLVLLQLSLSKPQYRHVTRLADAIIVCESPYKTLTSLYNLIFDAPDASNAAGCLRISPWRAADLQEPLRAFTLNDLLKWANWLPDEALFISIDDSLTAKEKDTCHLEPVIWHYDHTKSGSKKSAYTNGTVHIEVRIQLGDQAYVYDWGWYLRKRSCGG